MPTPTIHDLYKVDIRAPQAQPIILQLSQLLCRKIWGMATAYRLGLVSNITGLANPYPPDLVNHELFNRGSMTPIRLLVEELA